MTGLLIFAACNHEPSKENMIKDKKQKIVVYQVFTRLFGNTNTTNKAWGTLEENGVGKFKILPMRPWRLSKNLGVSHIWYTGVLHHAMVTDYSDYRTAR